MVSGLREHRGDRRSRAVCARSAVACRGMAELSGDRSPGSGRLRSPSPPRRARTPDLVQARASAPGAG